MIEARGDLRRNRGLHEHLREIKQEVVVIEHVLPLLHLDVSRKQRAQGRLVRRDPWKPFVENGLEVAAGVDDARIDGEARPLGRKALFRVAVAAFVPRPVHEVGRILAVVDGELRIEAEPERIFAQEPGADRVERARIGRRRRGGRLGRETPGQKPLDPPAKLRRRAAREGGEHDALGIGAGEDKRGHPMRQHRRLPRARAGDDEQWSETVRTADPVLDSELLLGIELNRRARANQGERHRRNAIMFRALFARAADGYRTALLGAAGGESHRPQSYRRVSSLLPPVCAWPRQAVLRRGPTAAPPGRNRTR